MAEFSPQAAAELNQFLARGRIGPPPEAVAWLRPYVRLIGNDQPFIGDEIVVEWQGDLGRRGRRQWLVIGGHRLGVLLSGRLQIQVGQAPFVIALVDDAGGEVARCEVRPRARVPTLAVIAPQTIERGERAAVEWGGDYLARVVVRIDSPGELPQSIDAGVAGRISLEDLAVGEHRFTVIGIGIHHAADPAAFVERVVVVAVVAPRPRIVAVAERRVTLGEPWVIEYRAEEATDTTLTFEGQEAHVPLTDRIVLHPSACGRSAARLVANGPGGQKVLDLVLDVVAPPVDIRGPRRVAVQFGESVAVPYAVRNAQSVSIRPLDRPWNDEFDAPAQGRIEIDEVTQGERVLITAVAMDGMSHREVVVVEVGPPGAMVDVREELSLLYSFDWRSVVGGI